MHKTWKRASPVSAAKIAMFTFASMFLICPETFAQDSFQDAAATTQIQTPGQQLEDRQYAESEEKIRKALALATKHNCNRDQICDLHNYLAVMLHIQGKDEQAIEQFMLSLNLVGKSNKREQLRRAKILSNLALSLSSTGRSSEGLRYMTDALHAFEKTEGGPMEESILLNDYGRLLLINGQFQNAEEAIAKSIKLRQSVVGTKSTTLLPPLLNLSTILMIENNTAAAEQICLRSIAICEESAGAENESLFQVLLSYASVMAAQSKYKDAQELLKKAISLSKNRSGDPSPSIGIALFNLSKAYEADNNPNLAEQSMEKALDIYRLTLGLSNRKTLEATIALAELYESHGKQAESESLRILCRTMQKALKQAKF